MYKKFCPVNYKNYNEYDIEYVADSIGEIISPIPARAYVLDSRETPTSII